VAVSTPVVVVFSGKRKSGKDFVCEKLKKEHFGDQCCLLRLSSPLKKEFAKAHGLDFELLLTDSPYKEDHRVAMIEWGEKKREEDPNYFCNLVAASAPSCPIWIVCDSRRPSDIAYFTKNFATQLILVRVEASQKDREARGWVFTKGVDDADSECALDSFAKWHFVLNNSSNTQSKLLQQLNSLVALCKTKAGL